MEILILILVVIGGWVLFKIVIPAFQMTREQMKDISMYHFLRKCDGDKENGPIQVNFEPGPNKALS